MSKLEHALLIAAALPRGYEEDGSDANVIAESYVLIGRIVDASGAVKYRARGDADRDAKDRDILFDSINAALTAFEERANRSIAERRSKLAAAREKHQVVADRIGCVLADSDGLLSQAEHE